MKRNIDQGFRKSAKICPRCKAIGKDIDNFCGKCGYIYNKEITLQKDMYQEYCKTVKIGKTNYRFTVFTNVILFLLLLLMFCAFASFEPWITVTVGVLLFACIYLFISIVHNSTYLHEKVRRYTPEKKFRYFRKSTEQRRRPLKIKRNFFRILMAASAIYCIFFVVLRLDSSLSWAEITFSITLIIFLFYIESIIQKSFLKIKYHQTIDDATYFELEELGLIKETDVVISLYKDFTSWNNVKVNSKILILTQDTLTCLVFSDRTHARKVTITLNKIDELGIVKAFIMLSMAKAAPSGMVITIGWHKQYFRIVLTGLSIQDSSEEFVSRFLKQLDNAILSRPHDEIKTYQRSESTTSENIEQIRQIEILEISKADTTAGTVNPPSRIIDL